MADFNGLYEFNSSSGVAIPDTNTFKEKIESFLKEKFGNDFDLSPASIGGRLSELLTMFGITVLGVNAQNSNVLNPDRCAGSMLDNLASIFGVNRGEMTDSQLRENLKKGFAPGNGFAMSIDRAVLNVEGVENVVMLVNRYKVPVTLPNDSRGILVDPNSVFICVKGGDVYEIAHAIHKAAPINCGFSVTEEHGTKEVIGWTDGNITDNITVYRPISKSVDVTIKIRNLLESDINSVKAEIEDYLKDKRSNIILHPADFATPVSKYGYLSSVTFDGDLSGESIVIKPDHYVTFNVSVVNERN